ncbi:MAG: hypothetical protein M0Z87_11100 [Actinomycetota bacterium]|nr:hypothetical protein [Actinomycetota bacterium]
MRGSLRGSGASSVTAGAGSSAGSADGEPALVDVASVYRRAVVIAAASAVVAAVVGVVAGTVLFGVGALGGVALGALNNRTFQARSKRMLAKGGVKKGPVASSVLARLAAVTALAFYLIYAVPALGWGLLAGVAFFQMSLMGSAIGSLLRNRANW